MAAKARSVPVEERIQDRCSGAGRARQLRELKTLPFVMFRAFVCALRQYQSLVFLLQSGAWEDALILVRSPYELNVNLSEIATAQDPEERARRTFVTFGKFHKSARTG